MATSKTLAPTNVTISIPAMTDAPDQSVNSNCIDKLGDAVNALNSQIGNLHSARVNWGTSVSGSGFHQGILMFGAEAPIMVWFASTADIGIRGLCEPQFTKSAQNSITFGIRSATDSNVTITRSGDTITVTTTSSATICLIYV